MQSFTILLFLISIIGDGNRRRHSVEQEDSGDELDEIDDDIVGHLKEVHKGKKGRTKKRNVRSK